MRGLILARLDIHTVGSEADEQQAWPYVGCAVFTPNHIITSQPLALLYHNYITYPRGVTSYSAPSHSITGFTARHAGCLFLDLSSRMQPRASHAIPTASTFPFPARHAHPTHFCHEDVMPARHEAEQIISHRYRIALHRRHVELG